MRKIKKLTALFLAALMVLGTMTMTASALTKDATGTINVEVTSTTEENKAALDVSAYKLMTVNYNDAADQPEKPEFVWDTNVGTWLKNNTNETYKTFVGENNVVTSAFGNLADDSNDSNKAVLKAFYDALAAAIRAKTIDLTVAKTVKTNAEGKAALTEMKMGNYLVLIEGGTDIYSPSAVNLIPTWNETSETWEMTTANVVIKSEPVTIDKNVSDAEITTYNYENKEETLAIGDTAYFVLNAKVPEFPEKAIAETFHMSDKLPVGLTLDAGSIVVKGWNGNAEVNLTESNAGNKYFTLTTENATRPVEGGTTPVTFAVNFVYDEIKAYSNIAIYYSAKLNENAVVGAAVENIGYLTYSNDPYNTDSYETDDSTTEVFTYGIDVTKVDKADTNKGLAGAEFILSTDVEGENKIQFVKDSDGVYHKASAKELANASTTDDLTKLVVSDNGKLVISGLDAEKDAGTKYYLTETKAPNEYVILNAPVEITIIAGVDEKGELDGSADYNYENELKTAADGFVPVTIANEKHFNLPTTGGMGTVLFTAAGFLIMAAGVAMFIAINRRKRA